MMAKVDGSGGADIRARVMYYHQVGYYARGVRESRKKRRTLIPYYTKVLTGRDASALESPSFEAHVAHQFVVTRRSP